MILSIIIPVFNEEKTVGEILEKVYQIKLPKKFTKEILVINDGSTDNSAFKIQNSEFGKKIRLITHQKNLGKGAAVRTGIKHATGGFIIIQDSDLEYDPQDYQKLLEPVLEKNAKVVFGTRLKNYPLNFWGRNKAVLPTHLMANKFLTILTNILYGSKLTDMETGYKLIESKLLKKIKLKSHRFDFEPEVTAKILKLKIPIVEIPIKVRPRTYREGKKIGWKDGFIAIWTLIKYRFID